MLRDKLLQPTLESRLASLPVALHPLGWVGVLLGQRMQLTFGAQEEGAFGDATGTRKPKGTIDKGLCFTRRVGGRLGERMNEGRARAPQS